MTLLTTIPWFRPGPIRIPLFEGSGWLPETLSIQPFGILVALGVLLGVHVAMRRAQRDGVHPRVVAELAGYQLFGGFVLGHVIDAIFYHPDVVAEDPLFVLELWNGLSSFGGFVGAAVGSVIWVRLRGYSFLTFADPIAYSFPFGWLLGRLGCFSVHDHPGKVTDFPLAVADYQIRGGSPPWQARHDLGLYEVLWCLVVIPLFLWLGRRSRLRGFYLALLPLLYAPVRFGLDFLRATDVLHGDPRYAGLTPGHYAAIALFAAGLLVAARIRRQPTPPVPLEARWTPEAHRLRTAREVDQPTLARLLRAAKRAHQVRVVEPTEADRGGIVQRWPGALLVFDLRGHALQDEVTWQTFDAEREALSVGDPEAKHVWLLSAEQLQDGAAAPALLDRLRSAASEAAGRHLVVMGGASAEASARAAERARAQTELPVRAAEDPERPLRVLELPDGSFAFGAR